MGELRPAERRLQLDPGSEGVSRVRQVSFTDLRDWLGQVDELGELRRLDGVELDGDLGAIAAVVGRRQYGPAVLFDRIPGFAPGFRVLVNSLGSPQRTALTLGLPPDISKAAFMTALHRRVTETAPIPPVTVADGPILENVLTGGEIDLLKIPAPIWHEGDGGRYIGTGAVTITRDPDDGRVNLGTYRVMTVDRDHVTLYISPGKHGAIMRDKYFARGEPCPVVITVGSDPLTFIASSLDMMFDELSFVGGIRGEPLPVVTGRFTGLPIPAGAEIAIEGFLHPGDTAPEGPFGEWTGYYASGSREEPVVEVKALYHRNQPILLGSPPVKPPNEHTVYRSPLRSVMIRHELEQAGVPDVTGVWAHECGGTRLLLAVSIKQRYPGHARQAGMIACACHAGNYLGRYVVVVDEDVDVTDLQDVMWAVCTRSEPSESIDIIRRTWSGPLDPRVPQGQKGFNSRAIIDATRPYEWKDQFPKVVAPGPEAVRSVMERWGSHLFSGGER